MSAGQWRFLVDEGMPRSTAAMLLQAGYAAEDVRDVSLRGGSDDEVFAYAQAREAAVVARDLDFADAPRFAPHTAAGIIVVRLPNTMPVRRVNAILLDALADIPDESLRGLLVIVEAGRTRIRRPGRAQ